MDATDHSILKHLAENPSATDVEIAENVGVSRSTVVRRRKSPALQAELNKVFEIDSTRVTSLLKQALDNLEDLMKSPDDRVRLKASQMVLETAGRHLEDHVIWRSTGVFKALSF